MTNPLYTFGLGADGQKAILSVESEQGPDAEGVPAQHHLPVGRVQDTEGEHTVQLSRHGLGPQLLVQVDQRFPVTRRAHLQGVRLCQLKTIFKPTSQISSLTKQRTHLREMKKKDLESSISALRLNRGYICVSCNH